MNREQLIELIRTNVVEWSCDMSCNGNYNCRACAERIVTEYEQAIRQEVLEALKENDNKV